jgi:hypothetical protein
MEIGMYIMPPEPAELPLIGNTNIEAFKITEPITLILIEFMNLSSQDIVCILYHPRPPQWHNLQFPPVTNTNLAASQLRY